MRLIDTKRKCNKISLPQSGVIPVNRELTDIDLTLLEQELKEFYGDRFQIVESPVIPAFDPKSSKKSRSSSSRRRSPSSPTSES